MAQWSHDNPGRGDVSQVRAFSTEQGRRASEFQTVVNGLETVTATVTDSNSSTAVDQWHSRATQLKADFRTTIDWLHARRDAANTYAAAVESIAGRATGVRQRLSNLHYLHYLVQSQAIPDGSLQARLAELEAQISEQKTQLGLLANEREDADSAFSLALTSQLSVPGLVDWAVAQKMYGAAALTGTYGDFRARREVVLNDTVALMTAADRGGLSDTDLARLATLLGQAAGDPEFAHDLWTRVGGDAARDLLWEIERGISAEGADANAPEAAVALAMRDSIASASTLWDDARATEFVDSFLPSTEKIVTWGTGLEAVDFLFANPEVALMGAALTTAFATRLDRIERSDANNSKSVGLRKTTALSGGLYALTHPQPEPYERHLELFDPMAHIFDTMTHHPQAALDWLTDSTPDPFDSNTTTGDSRIAHYYGVREWAHDGWAGPAALWETAMTVPGGFHEGATSGDVYDAQIQVTEEVVTVLGGRDGRDFAPGDLSDAAATSMATSLNVALPWLMETTIAGGQTGGRERYQFLSVGDGYRMAVADPAELAGLWGTVGSSDAGLVALSEAVGGHQQQVLQTAYLGDFTGVEWETAFEDYVALEGFHFGSLGGVQEMQARISDENFATGLDLAGAGFGMMRFPFSEKIPEGAVWAAEQLLSAAQSGAEDYATDRWGNELQVAEELNNSQMATGYFAMEARLEGLLSAPGLGASEGLSQADANDLKSRMLDDYSDEYVASLERVNREGLADAFREEQQNWRETR